MWRRVSQVKPSALTLFAAAFNRSEHSHKGKTGPRSHGSWRPSQTEAVELLSSPSPRISPGLSRIPRPPSTPSTRLCSRGLAGDGRPPPSRGALGKDAGQPGRRSSFLEHELSRVLLEDRTGRRTEGRGDRSSRRRRGSRREMLGWWWARAGQAGAQQPAGARTAQLGLAVPSQPVGARLGPSPRLLSPLAGRCGSPAIGRVAPDARPERAPRAGARASLVSHALPARWGSSETGLRRSVRLRAAPGWGRVFCRAPR